ncbi:hypothetical protein [Yinghuangia seranimata]|uniref:hypothetical protein n=1 Tax=Yinghuangia seranimata TaxID=408067 RepID=UPI00248BC55D|nr:hypothetical protein [Yinghuangia seranimata]MDI2128701.1 hypothetical protein [Yinghuangia seranimata]
MHDRPDQPGTAERERQRRRVDLNGTQVAASALAAVSSAFLLSTLGVAGTVIGAAIASVVATVGSAVYVHVFRRTGDQLRDARAYIATPSNAVSNAPLPPDLEKTRVLPVFDPNTYGTQAPSAPTAEPARGRTWLVRSAVAALAVFAIAMTAITVVEVGTGRSFASLFGNGNDRPSITQIGGGGGSGHQQQDDGTRENKTPREGSTPSQGEDKPTSSGTPTSPTRGPDPTGSASPPPPTSAPPTSAPPTSPTTSPPTSSAPPTGQADSPSTGGRQSGQPDAPDGARNG